MTLPGPEPRYEVARKGTALGTYALPDIAAEIASGKLVWTDDCWTEGMESWCKLADIKDQVDSLASAGTAASPPSRTPVYVGIAVISILSIGAASYLYLSPNSGIAPADSAPPPPAAAAAECRGDGAALQAPVRDVGAITHDSGHLKPLPRRALYEPDRSSLTPVRKSRAPGQE